MTRHLMTAVVTALATMLVFGSGMAVALNVPNNSVNSNKIVDNSIRSADIRDGAVKTVDIRNGTITSTDIRNGTIGTADMSVNAVDSWFANFNETLYRTGTEDNSPGSGTYWTGSAACPGGGRAVAGSGSIGTSDAYLTDSYPLGVSEWRVRWESEGGANLTPTFVRVWLLCLPPI